MKNKSIFLKVWIVAFVGIVWPAIAQEMLVLEPVKVTEDRFDSTPIPIASGDVRVPEFIIGLSIPGKNLVEGSSVKLSIPTSWLGYSFCLSITDMGLTYAYKAEYLVPPVLHDYTVELDVRSEHLVLRKLDSSVTLNVLVKLGNCEKAFDPQEILTTLWIDKKVNSTLELVVNGLGKRVLYQPVNQLQYVPCSDHSTGEFVFNFSRCVIDDSKLNPKIGYSDFDLVFKSHDHLNNNQQRTRFRVHHR